jgi:hypothetical protein
MQFGALSCPPLERREGYEVIRFDQDGRTCTSDRFEEQEGIARDRLFYLFDDGQRAGQSTST